MAEAEKSEALLKEKNEKINSLELELQTMRATMLQWEHNLTAQIAECAAKDLQLQQAQESSAAADRNHRQQTSRLVDIIQEHERKIEEKEIKAQEIFARLEARNEKERAAVQAVLEEERRTHAEVVTQLRERVSQARADLQQQQQQRNQSRALIPARPPTHFMTAVALPGLLLTFVISFGVYCKFFSFTLYIHKSSFF